jgi:hypothetical protein
MGHAAHAQLTQVRMSGIGLQIPAGLKYDDWAKAGRQLSGIVDSSAWWLGDWLVFGKANYADRYQLAIQSAGLSYQTLRNYAWVARRFEMTRRHAKLSFKHHAEVASLPVEVQDRLLDQAESEEWTTKRLRSVIQQERRIDPEHANELRSRIDLPRNRVGMWRRAATYEGVEFDQWVQRMLDRAATEVLIRENAQEGIEVPPRSVLATG